MTIIGGLAACNLLLMGAIGRAQGPAGSGDQRAIELAALRFLMAQPSVLEGRRVALDARSYAVAARMYHTQWERSWGSVPGVHDGNEPLLQVTESEAHSPLHISALAAALAAVRTLSATDCLPSAVLCVVENVDVSVATGPAFVKSDSAHIIVVFKYPSIPSRRPPDAQGRLPLPWSGLTLMHVLLTRTDGAWTAVAYSSQGS